MIKRRAPLVTSYSSTVIYPSALFSLEKDETYPYERFAYNVLSVAVEALNTQKLPENITIDFTQSSLGFSPWSINASISVRTSRDGVLFHFGVPELAPAILYLLSAVLLSEFLDDARFQTFQQDPARLSERLKYFVEGASSGVRAYRENGFAAGIRAAYEFFGLTFVDLQRYATEYDALTKLIANHEVAHAYVQQVTHRPNPTQVETSAFEFVADLVAIFWFYNKMIANTPNTEEYREYRGLASYSETILANSLTSLRALYSLIIVMAIAGAQRTGGRVSLEAGQTHPAGLQRLFLQHVVLYTLIASNFSSTLSKDAIDEITNDWDLRMEVLVRSGLIPLADLENMLNPAEFDAVETAANLIEELQIADLQKVSGTLRQMRDQIGEPKRERRKGRQK